MIFSYIYKNIALSIAIDIFKYVSFNAIFTTVGGIVVGNSAVIVAFGLLAGAAAAVLLTACMAAAGVPMILEYVDDYLRNQEKEKNTLELN